MTFPETVKTTLWDIIDEMSSQFLLLQIILTKGFYADASLISKK